MLFEQRFVAGIQDGSVTLTFRRWRRRQAVPGHTYRTIAGRLEATSVEVVDAASITDDEARAGGYPSAEALVGDLRGETEQPVYRVAFRYLDEPDPRSVLAAEVELAPEAVAELERRLDRLDRASASGPWTAATLALIAERPAVRAGDLAPVLGRELAPFKLDVRKLKALGLTLSLEVGYRLSPRGQAYLAATTRPGVTSDRDEASSVWGGRRAPRIV